MTDSKIATKSESKCFIVFEFAILLQDEMRDFKNWILTKNLN